MTQAPSAKFGLGQIVRHREQAFRGVVIDVDPDLRRAIPDQPGRDHRDQPFYQVLAIGPETAGFIAYAAEGVLEVDPDLSPLSREAEALVHGRQPRPPRAGEAADPLTAAGVRPPGLDWAQGKRARRGCRSASMSDFEHVFDKPPEGAAADWTIRRTGAPIPRSSTRPGTPCTRGR
jgi:heat shock protein HspQ